MRSDPRTYLKQLGKRLPPIAWRDDQIKILRTYASQLQAEIRRLGGKVPPAPSRSTAGVHLLQTPGRQAAVVRASGLFDEDWYAAQLDPGTAPDDLVRHYLTSGHEAGLSATPAFAEQWYRSQLAGRAKSEPPLLHYLTSGTAGSISVHPAFPIGDYVEAHPDSVDHAGGPLGHYLSLSGDALRSDSPWLASEIFLTRARAAAVMLQESRGHEHLPRQVETFDHEAERAFKESLLSDASLLSDPPKVTVVLPTKDRSTRLRHAIDSIQAQTYDSWELIVVDDGSTEDIEALVAEYSSFDPRITCLRHQVNRGVAAARNTAITAATGTYVAYLDSDNTWEPDFLELMVRHLERNGAAVAYSASGLVEQGGQGRRLYRGMPFSREALRERNYIDCIVVVHERRLLDEVGGFDETLRRTVDWDLLIRLADAADFSFAPFVGTQYDLWEEGGDRITTDVAEGYRFRVRERTLVDWEAARVGLPSRGEHLSVVIAAMQPGPDLVQVVERLLTVTAAPLEVVIVDNHLPDGTSVLLHTTFAHRDDVRYVRLPQRLTPELARNVGIVTSTGRHVVVMNDRAWTYAGWEAPLVEELGSSVAVQPVVLAHSGEVWSAGVSFAGDGVAHHAYTGFSGDAPELRGTREVDAVSAAVLAARAEDLLAVEGFDPLYMRDEHGPELSLRLREATGRKVAVVGQSHVAFHSDPRRPTKAAAIDVALQNEANVSALWTATSLSAVPDYERSGYRVDGYVRDAVSRTSISPVLVHDRPGRPLRWAIKIGVYSVTDRESWGDWHFAQALRDALEGLGHEVTIDTRDAWYRRTSNLDDVALVLQGRGRFVPTPGQVSAVWVYSHPSEAPLRDLAAFDLAFGASASWCRRAASFSRRQPEHLMQCTDPERFHPVLPDPALAHDVLMVGNARGIRPVVRTALEAGVVPDVYGKNWQELLPPGAWKGEYVPNAQLPAYYASAGVVLNDHWDEMREWGLISNRLFDAAACGARLVSDRVEGIEDIFGDVVLTYGSPEELRQAVELHRTEDGPRVARRMELAETVRAEHSFHARAVTITDWVREVLREKDSLRQNDSADRPSGASVG